ncbi:gibberellin 2-beta-dioxygenase [Lotus japonicus]|uniref:gibberellin 2-beta-dioxygenase n=1 Tax=Lotus japonicus TaxID=34305 RepID=UPI002585440D|nr:gibberellin 2-beta-dioxygenase [Lotus japonicus]
MVVHSQQGALNELFLIKTCKPTNLFTEVPEVDLSHPEAKTLIVNACKEFGFFKIINHDIPMELISNLENEALSFFMQPQSEKEKASLDDPFGYGSKRIGKNGDVGWVEYLLFNTNPDVISPNPLLLLEQNQNVFSSAVNDYTLAVKNLSCEILELMADGLGIEQRNVFSRLIRDEKSDCIFRLNHYPACGELELQAIGGRNLIGFGEHTDPQMISVLRSNNTSGLQICLRDGTWVSIPPDQTSFFINVGDSLQVMTNGSFRSVKHRVLSDTAMSRVSMIYFGGAPLTEKLAPLPSLVSKEEDSLYKEFTWGEYKKAAYKLRLADNRLTPFEKSAGQ